MANKVIELPELIYVPQPKQEIFHTSLANEILYGGAAGGGKSAALRGEGFRWCVMVPGLQAYLFRREFPDLERNHIIQARSEFPTLICSYNESKHRFNFSNGSMMHFCHCQYDKDVFSYQGAEIHWLGIDEVTQFTAFAYDYLRGRVRCSLDIPEQYRSKIPGIYCGANPGGPGHIHCKSRWVDFAKPYELKQTSKREGGMLRQYIPATLEDNFILMRNDPGYADRLDALPEPYRTAYKTGDWNIFMGQMFAFNYQDHVIKPYPVPEGDTLYMTFDWGFGKPFSVGWWFIDNDGRVIRFAEMYGNAPGSEPDVGLRLSDDEIANRIIGKEKYLGLEGRSIVRLAGHDCFSKKPAYGQGGQIPSTAEVFARKGLLLKKSDPNRVAKIRQFHQRLAIPKGGDRPMLQVFDICTDFIRTIPMLQADKNNMEDVEQSGAEDHIFEESVQICVMRPIGNISKQEGNFTSGAGIPAGLGAE